MPALVAVVVGLIGFVHVSERQGLSRELIGSGSATAQSTQVDVVGVRGAYINKVHVEFATSDGRRVRADLFDFEDNSQGMIDGSQAPRSGTRYAPPLQLVYRASDPSVVLARRDTERWLAQRDRRLVYGALFVGGTLAFPTALVLLTVGARRRGLAWWKWYSAGTPNSP